MTFRFISAALLMAAMIPVRMAGAETGDDGSVALDGPGDSYIFKNVRCSEVDLGKVTVDGRAFNPERDRLSVYGNSAIVIADGWTDPLTIYKEEECKGESMVLDFDRYYRSDPKEATNFLPEEELGSFDNAIRSFRLKNGFMCTMANNPDGTGYSRVFIASDGDLVVNEMPEGLAYVSFVRVCRHDWIGKRGVSAVGDLADLSRSSWHYDWGASATSTEDYEYVPMRHNKWWDGWDKIGSRVNSANVLGFNEPDHSDQSDLGTEVAFQMWPEFMKSGLRIGSPAPDNINSWWLKEFLAKADSLNYRVDFVATHMYWNSTDPYALADQITSLCKNSYGKRPMWITEMNNGANWTHEGWPDANGPARDASFNIIKEDSIIVRPHTEANSAKQVEWITKMLDAFDNCPWLERHAVYNWVEDARALWLDGPDGPELTPAGKVFAAHDSRPAFSRETEHVHKWKICPPRMESISKNRTRVRINFYDINGETGAGYKVQRRINGGEWTEIAIIRPDTDYKVAQSTFFTDKDLVGGFHEYRFKGIAPSGRLSIYSRVIGIEVPVSGIDAAEVGNGLSVFARGGEVVIESESEGRAEVYRPDGRLVRQVDYTPGETTVGGLSSGIYIVAGQKVVL